MKHSLKLIAGLALCTLALHGCAGTEAPARTTGANNIFSSADADGSRTLSYPEFKRFAFLESAGRGADAVNQRRAEEMAGNRELHKRFIFMDGDNNGQLSHAEIVGH